MIGMKAISHFDISNSPNRFVSKIKNKRDKS